VAATANMIILFLFALFDVFCVSPCSIGINFVIFRALPERVYLSAASVSHLISCTRPASKMLHFALFGVPLKVLKNLLISAGCMDN
jgi:hypothetical protein